MKPQTDPVAPEEWLIRLVWEDRFTARVPVISPNAFEPREGRHPDTDGLSFYRRDCLNDPTDVLAAVAEDKRSRYGLVLLPVSLLSELGLTVRISPVPEVSGHVVVPELNLDAYKADKARF